MIRMANGIPAVTSRYGIDVSVKRKPRWYWVCCGIALVQVLICLDTAHGETRLCHDTSKIFVSETDPPGTILYRTPVSTVIDKWEADESYPFLVYYLNFVRKVDHFQLIVIKTLDLESIYETYGSAIRNIRIIVHCSSSISAKKATQRKYIDVIAVNEFAPSFNQSVIVRPVPLGHTFAKNAVVMDLAGWASDKDVNPMMRQMLTYHLDKEMQSWLYITDNTTQVRAMKKINFDNWGKTKSLTAMITVRSPDELGGSATLVIKLQDMEDLPPVFTYQGCSQPCHAVHYSAMVKPEFSGKVMHLKPGNIQAFDGDGFGNPVRLSITHGPPGFMSYVKLDSANGELTIAYPLGEYNYTHWNLIVQATEESSNRMTKSTTLHLSLHQDMVVEPEEDNVPLICVIVDCVFLVIILVIIAIYFYRTCRGKKSDKPTEDQVQEEMLESTEESDDVKP